MQAMAPIFIVAILLLVPLLLLFLHHRNRLNKKQPFPPGPKPWPIIGNLPLMGDNPHVSLANIAKTHGPLISIHLGTQLLIVGSSPEAASAILKTHDRELSGRPVPHVSFAKDPDINRDSIAWTFECSEEWKSFRSLMRNELFGSRVVDSQSLIRERKLSEMVRFLNSKEGEIVQIREVLFVNTFNSLANVYMSRDFIGFEGGSKRMSVLVREMMELWTVPNVSDLFPILSGFDLQGLKRKADVCVKRMCEIWDSTIRERREQQSNKVGEDDDDDDDDVKRKRDFLDVLLDSGFSDEQISLIFVVSSQSLLEMLTHL